MNAIGAVGVVVVNFNGGDMVVECVRSLLATDWDSPLQIVVVDNASTDGSFEALSAMGGVRVVPAGANLGYAVANNIGLRELRSCDAVALVNSDAFVSPGWLRPLAAALDGSQSELGAACPKIVLESVFAEVVLTSPTFVPGGADRRTLGLRVTGVVVDGVDVFDQCVFVEGWSWPEDHARWTTGAARLFVPVSAASTSIDILVDGESSMRRFAVGERFDVINNVGNELTADWYGRDRGFLEIDGGQYDKGTDVWGWCGAAVLLSRSYLEATTGFDERFFLYYEDVEWAWRGRKLGWRYAYVPESVVRHRHSASTVQGSALFEHLNQRNRLVLLAMHAPAGAAAGAWVRFGGEIARNVWGEAVGPLLHRRRPHLNVGRRRIKSAVGALRRLPSALAARRHG